MSLALLAAWCSQCHWLCSVPSVTVGVVSPPSPAVLCPQHHWLCGVSTVTSCTVSPPSPAVREHQLVVSDVLATAPSDAGQCSRGAQTRLFKRLSQQILQQLVPRDTHTDILCRLQGTESFHEEPPSAPLCHKGTSEHTGVQRCTPQIPELLPSSTLPCRCCNK